METQTFTFASSQYVPIAIGFFGLATGYFIWGGQALFGFPKTSPEVNRTMGLWGFWMPGFMQFITGVYLLIGLTWFNVFGKEAPLYMAALAFTAYGVHWFAMGYRRYVNSSDQPDGWMDGYCLPLSQYSRTLRFPACGGHSRHDRLCRSDVDLCHGNSDALVLVGFGWPSRRPVPVRDWHLATVLYVCHHGKPSARSQSVDIAATRVTNSPEAQSVRHASEEARRDHVAVANQADKHTLRHPPESQSQRSQRQPAAA